MNKICFETLPGELELQEWPPQLLDSLQKMQERQKRVLSLYVVKQTCRLPEDVLIRLYISSISIQPLKCFRAPGISKVVVSALSHLQCSGAALSAEFRKIETFIMQGPERFPAPDDDTFQVTLALCCLLSGTFQPFETEWPPQATNGVNESWSSYLSPGFLKLPVMVISMALTLSLGFHEQSLSPKERAL